MPKPVNTKAVVNAEKVFRKYLLEHGLKYTGERRLLLQAVVRNNGHFEAEQLLLDMRQASERVAKATVYRTLKLLVDCGIVREVQFTNKQVHYEHTYGDVPHDHMICRHCGRIIEFDAVDVLRLREKVAREHGFRSQSHRFQIRGLCALCLKTEDDELPAE